MAPARAASALGWRPPPRSFAFAQDDNLEGLSGRADDDLLTADAAEPIPPPSQRGREGFVADTAIGEGGGTGLPAGGRLTHLKQFLIPSS
jgi:hypothetical protein